MNTLRQKSGYAAQIGYALSAWALAALVVLQVYYAGVAVLVDPAAWSSHISLGHRMGWPLIALLFFAIAGRMPRKFTWFALGLYLLYALQYVFLHWTPTGFTGMRALHAVNALAIFVLAHWVAREAWSLVRQGRRN